jgi:hypothetical protein
MWRPDKEKARLHAERRKREDDAPRLAQVVPNLLTLRLEIHEENSGISTPEATYVRHIVVASAPALFVLPCHDKECKDGGHDLTREITTALRAKKTRFTGEDACSGHVGSANCRRILRYTGISTFQGD